MGLLFIDGAERRAYVAAARGLHGALKFTYRPMITEERDALLEAIHTKGSKEQGRLISTALAARVKWWDARDAGQMVEITADNLRRLQPNLFGRLYGIVIGSQPTDALPDGTDVDESEDFQDETNA